MSVHEDVTLDAEGYHLNGPVEELSDQSSAAEQESETEYHIPSTKRQSLSPSRTPQALSCVLNFI